MNVHLIELAIYLIIDVGFWYRFAAPALRRAQAPDHVRRVVLGITILTAIGIVFAGIYVVSGITVIWLAVVLNLPTLCWLLLVFMGWPGYRQLTRLVMWWQSRRRSA